MKIYKRILVLFLTLLLIIFSFNLLLNLWIGIKIDTLLNKNNKLDYTFTYEKIDISVIDRSFFITEINVVPKQKKLLNSKKSGVYAKVKSVEISQIDVWNLFSSGEINAGRLDVTKPSIVFYKNKISDNKNQEAEKSLKNSINIENIFIENCSFKNIDSQNEQTILEAFNLNLNLKKVAFSRKTLNSKIPFSFDNYSLECDSVYFHSNEFYDFKSNTIVSSKNSFKANDFEMIPLYTRKEFVKRVPLERDLYTISCPEIKVENMNWGFKDSVFFFTAKSTLLNEVSANIYRSKIPKDNLTKKNLYNKMLRELKFNLDIDTLKIKNSLLVYEEEISFEKGAGKLVFENFNLTATNIESGLGKKNTHDMKIKINCNFMKTSPLNIDWSLNVLDKTDGFRIKGSILNFDVEKINQFSLPYVNVKVDGVFDKVIFDFLGNDVSSAGKFAIEYDDLKVTIFKNGKKDRKKNKFLTAVGNLFVKKDSKEKLKDANVKLDRIKEKSFYNFLWLNLAEGLKKILI